MVHIVGEVHIGLEVAMAWWMCPLAEASLRQFVEEYVNEIDPVVRQESMGSFGKAARTAKCGLATP